MCSKVHSHGNVPFSWENKPGISKAAEAPTRGVRRSTPSKLPPPPCPPPPENSRVSAQDLQIPLPPCAFQPPPPSRSASKKGVGKMDDPFLIALKEVTKSTKKGKTNLGGDSVRDQGFGLMKNASFLSCKKYSCSVAENSVVKLSQLPHSRSQKERGSNY